MPTTVTTAGFVAISDPVAVLSYCRSSSSVSFVPTTHPTDSAARALTTTSYVPFAHRPSTIRRWSHTPSRQTALVLAARPVAGVPVVSTTVSATGGP